MQPCAGVPGVSRKQQLLKRHRRNKRLGLLAGLFGQVLPVRAGVGARLQAGDLLQAQFDGLGRIAQVIHQAVGVVVLAGGAEGADHRGGDYPGEAADGVEPG